MRMYGAPHFVFDNGIKLYHRKNDVDGGNILILRDARLEYDSVWLDMPTYSKEKLVRAIEAFNAVLEEPDEVRQAAE